MHNNHINPSHVTISVQNIPQSSTGTLVSRRHRSRAVRDRDSGVRRRGVGGAGRGEGVPGGGRLLPQRPCHVAQR